MFTPFSDLDALLADLVSAVREILGPTYVGTYVQGSFALGAGDVSQLGSDILRRLEAESPDGRIPC